MRKILTLVCLLLMGTCAASANIKGHLKTEDFVSDMIDHPAFEGFGRYLMPSDEGAYEKYANLRLDGIASLLPYHGNVNPDVSIAAVNYMIDEVNSGKKIFYNLTTPNTGIFFFRGKPGAPFAVVCPGGGYVGSLHEGFPYALELCKKGY